MCFFGQTLWNHSELGGWIMILIHNSTLDAKKQQQQIGVEVKRKYYSTMQIS